MQFPVFKQRAFANKWEPKINMVDDDDRSKITTSNVKVKNLRVTYLSNNVKEYIKKNI